MRIIEVRDGFIKFEAQKDIALSSFVQIDDNKNSYIAQVLQIKRAGENSMAYAKILFLYNGAFNEYDNSLPEKDAEIKVFSYNLLKETFKPDNGIVLGNFIADHEYISTEKDFLDKKTLISVDSANICNTIIKNLTKQFKKTLVIDTMGIYDTPKYVAGIDFKLPLNTNALEFMFEDCLNDATSDSKSLIKEIFKDLADYSKTVPFVPFGALKSIVDEMVDKSHVFKLLVLKNKLAKFDKLGYFAATKQEADFLENIIDSETSVIDLSKLDQVFLNRYLSIILSKLETQSDSQQIFVIASNAVGKKCLKKILTGKNKTSFITHSRFKYINEIKSMFNNFVIEPSFNNNEVFKKFSTFLKAMQKDTYLIVGESTNCIPLISFVEEFSPEATTATQVQEELSNDQIEELEKALDEQPEDLSEILVETNPSIEAIEKKSEDLIEKVSEEVQTSILSDDLNIFEDEDTKNEFEEESTTIVEDTINEEAEQIEEISTLEEELTNEDLTIKEAELNNEEITLEDSNTKEELEIIQENNDYISKEFSQEDFHTQVDEIQTIEIPEEISDLTEEIFNEEEEKEEKDSEIVNQEEAIEEIIDSENTIEELETPDIATVTETESIDEQEQIISSETEDIPDIIPISEFNEEEFDEIIELDNSEITDADIIVDFEDEPTENINEEDLERSIVEDVDKVFTTIKEDTISDSDLDFIDELNNEVEDSIVEEITLSEGMEELSELQDFAEEDNENSFLEPLEEINEIKSIEETEEKEILETRSASTPIVPVYGADIPAEDIVMSDDIEQGDTVIHAKYGNGIVEKMIKYGTKTLYSINFDNVGRRLLDPTLTELKKG